MDAEHLFRFHVWTQNICSVFALKVAFSNLSGIVWTRPNSDSLFTEALMSQQTQLIGDFMNCDFQSSETGVDEAVQSL